MEESTAPKTIFKSKTLIVNAIIAVASLYPPVGEWVQSNPDTALQALAVINFVLRLVTKNKIVLFNK